MTDVEAILRSMPDAIRWPDPSPSLPSRVRARIEADESGRRRSRWRFGWAVVVVIAILVTVLPGTRQAIADLLGEAGVRIGFSDDTPATSADQLDLGEEVSLEVAEYRIGLSLRYPVSLGLPDASYVRGRLVTMVWDEGPILLMQQPSDALYAEKRLTPETQVTEVNVAGESGLWIEGAEHTFTFLDNDGNPIEVTSHLAGNVLLWSAGGVDFRLELTGELEEALDIARSLEER